LLELQFTGLVASVDNAGMFVSNMDPHRLVEAYQIREVFEGLAARLCCRNANRSDIAKMYDLADQTNQYARDHDLLHKSESDRQFHLSIIIASRNQALARLTKGYRALGMVVRTDRPIDIVYGEHRAIVKAIERDQPDLAEELARAHARAARELIEQQIADGTFVPHWVLPDGPVSAT
jgi:DNA-binding GntR family transcriptional regulator